MASQCAYFVNKSCSADLSRFAASAVLARFCASGHTLGTAGVLEATPVLRLAGDARWPAWQEPWGDVAACNVRYEVANLVTGVP